MFVVAPIVPEYCTTLVPFGAAMNCELMGWNSGSCACRSIDVILFMIDLHTLSPPFRFLDLVFASLLLITLMHSTTDPRISRAITHGTASYTAKRLQTGFDLSRPSET